MRAAAVPNAPSVSSAEVSGRLSETDYEAACHGHRPRLLAGACLPGWSRPLQACSDLLPASSPDLRGWSCQATLVGFLSDACLSGRPVPQADSDPFVPAGLCEHSPPLAAWQHQQVCTRSHTRGVMCGAELCRYRCRQQLCLVTLSSGLGTIHTAAAAGNERDAAFWQQLYANTQTLHTVRWWRQGTLRLRTSVEEVG